MFRLKDLSRGAWIVVGIVVALVLVPSGVAVATVAYNGIDGTNGTTTTTNDAHVTSAGQLLTTEATPSSFAEYSQNVEAADGQNGGTSCLLVKKIPTGKAFVIQEIQVGYIVVNSPTSDSDGNESNAAGEVFADKTTQTCGDGVIVTGQVAPGGAPGSLVSPLAPGYAVPSGYNLDAMAIGANIYVEITGYLVPSADAATTPTNSPRMKLAPKPVS
jgi:hypothetical protein